MQKIPEKSGLSIKSIHRYDAAQPMEEAGDDLNKISFTEWLRHSSGHSLSDYSIGRYANSLEKLSSELEQYRIVNTNLFALKNPEIIDAILSNSLFKEKNSNGHRMYSAALKKLYEFISWTGYEEEMAVEEINYEKYLKDTQIEKSDLYIKDLPVVTSNYRIVNNRKIWIRNPLYAKEALADADYLCEAGPDHLYFKSAYTGKNYVEAHHLIPVSFQERFQYSLDVHANITSLCPSCHRNVHFGLKKDREVILKTLFKKRQDRLKKSGVFITESNLFPMYQAPYTNMGP